jgi:hypothetical protein
MFLGTRSHYSVRPVFHRQLQPVLSHLAIFSGRFGALGRTTTSQIKCLLDNKHYLNFLFGLFKHHDLQRYTGF